MKKLIIIFLFLLLTVSIFGQWPYQQKPMLGQQINWADPLAKGLVGCLFLNEGAGNLVQDLSGNRNDGTLSGGASWTSSKFGSATIFETGEGAQKITVPHSESINFDGFTDSYTFIIWAKGGSQGSYRLAEKKTVAANAYPISLQGPVGVALNGVCYDGSNIVKVEFGTVWDNTLHQIAFVVDHTTDKAYGYLDGVEVDNVVNTTTSSTANNKPLYFSNNAESTRSFNGVISHVLIYNRALSTSEIAQLYREPFCFMLDDLPVSMMYNYAEEEAPSGQVIFIQMSAIPFFILAIVFLMRGKKCRTKIRMHNIYGR